jgi:hypothetical protein
MEISIAMLITAIAIALTYTIYNIVFQSYQAFKSKNVQAIEMAELDELLKKDFRQSLIIYKDSRGIRIDKNDEAINYDFEDAYITREGTAVDTFKIVVKDVKLLFRGSPVTEILSTSSKNRIDEVILNLVFNNQELVYHYRKQYSSTDLSY